MSSTTLQNLLLVPFVYLIYLLSLYYFQLFYVVAPNAWFSIIKICLHRILLQWKLHLCWQHTLQWSRAIAKLFHRVMFICEAWLMCSSHWSYPSWNVLRKMHISRLSSAVVTFAWWICGGEREEETVNETLLLDRLLIIVSDLTDCPIQITTWHSSLCNSRRPSP